MAQVSRNCLGGQGDKAIDHKVFAVSFVISNTCSPVGIYTVNGIGNENNMARVVSESLLFRRYNKSTHARIAKALII